MNIRFSLICIVLVLVMNCKGDQNTTDPVEENASNQKDVITARAIENFKFTDYVLSANGESVVANWDKYQELAIQVSYLRKADLTFFNGDKTLLKGFIDTLKMKIPDTLQTNAIVSRTVIMETTLLRLNENLTLDNIQDSLKLQSVKEVLVAFSNLNYQINKKIEKDIYDQIESEF
ncbi:hypothetical protein [Winogradskyella tangerina]|uniref:hypothetical protein n=1 Tax=Winogradskyella tangerina TaxID=2023240 RepID=UPI00130029EB|nr:hypothetical protein [Winogradskyella tangerina]